jgi:four helix bundle protein
LPQNTISKEIIAQLIRASGSVGANYREANDALSKKDFKHPIKITRKEAKESCYWFDLLLGATPEFELEIRELSTEASELKKIFSAIVDRCS